MNTTGKLAVRIATDAGFKVVLTKDVKGEHSSNDYVLRIMKHADGRQLAVETSPGDSRLREARAYSRRHWRTMRREAGDLGTLKEMLGV